ncbi:protein ELYS isoform X2 [Perognathus longimembris pacificus]|nr:protein ELYS isoform X2 [Perognathus longimembris pacificus]
MRDLTAQVTSRLLHFPEVTIQALGEDEITLESVLRGKFAAGKNGVACLACGPQLEVVNSVTGERLSAYRFNGVSEQSPVVLAVKEFSWQKRTGLLIGLEEAEGSILCLYDLGISRVVKAVVLPGRVTAIEPITNHGGASASTQHLHPSLRWLFGVAAVVTDVGQILLIDLCLDDLGNQNEVEASDLEVVTGIPAEVPHIRESVMREGRHLCFQLVSPSGVAVSALSYIPRTNQLAVGLSDGYLALWNMKSLKREYYTQLEGGRVPVYAVIFQEPENDPRNCCYLWAVQSTQDSEGDILSLHLLQLAFGDRKCLASGQILYEGLEYCEERYTLDLAGGMFPLRGQSSNTKLLGCQSIEKFRSHGEREESMNEALSPDTSVSVFTWQVNTYGQGKPSVYLGLFDINRWYHAQMPDSLRSGEYLHNCSYFALWSLDSVVSRTSPHYILDILVHERSLSRGVPPAYPPPEQFFNPSTFNFDATCLLNSGVIHITCTGFQKETLTFLKKSGPALNEVIPDGYNRCLVAGLLSPRLFDVQPSSLSREEQLEAVLSAAIQTSSLGLLTGCIRRWITEEQPNSAANLRFVLEWTWNKVSVTKEEFDRLCVPLFDGSCRFIDPQTIQSIQQCHLVLSNLNTVFSCFTSEAKDITLRGMVDLNNKHLVTQLICQYAQMVLWFSHSGLLPEGLDDTVQLSKLCYNYPSIQGYYTSHRHKWKSSPRGKWNHDCLMIDGLVAQLGDQVEKLWKRDEGGTGKYPPASLHALLDIYLLENVTEASKHSVTIYLLLDIMYSFPNKTDTPIESFPTAFAISWGQVKLIQGFWLIDHNDYESGLDLLFHPVTAKPVSWQHARIIQAFMSQGEHRQALRYIQTMRPAVSRESDVVLHLSVLLFNKCMVEAWDLLRQHSNRLNVEELLKHAYEICQEMGLMEDLLKLPFTDTEQECLVKFLQSSASVQNQEFLLVHHLQRANYIPALKLNQTLKINLMNDRDPRLRERSVARNSILDQYGKILPRVQRKLAIERAKPYHLSTASVFREVSRPKPLSTFPKKTVTGAVLTRSTFINNVLSKIGEVWASSEPRNSPLLRSSPKIEQPSPVVYSLPHPELPEAFVGTPVSKTSQKISRLLDLVVQPVPQPPQCLESVQQSPTRSPGYLLPSSLPLSSKLKRSHQNTSRSSELLLLETPLIVKKAKTLALSVASSGFAEFTPPSILRSGLRTTPLASPSLSPRRSLSPPLRLKETRISFMEEDVNTKWTAGAFHKCGFPAETEWLKSKDKSPSFSLNIPAKDEEGMDSGSQSTPSQGVEKLDVSKESSSVSARSDQTTLEYQDAPSPEDLEDSVFMSSKPADSSSALTTNLTEQPEKDGDEDVISSDVEKQIGTVEVAEEAISELNDVSPIQGVGASLGVSSVHEGKSLPSLSKVPVWDEGLTPVETCTSTIRADNNMADMAGGSPALSTSESPVISDQEVAQKAKDDDIEADVLKQSIDLPEEKPSISDTPPDSQEIHVVGHDKYAVHNSEEETRNFSFQELYPSGTLKLQYNFDTIEQQFCDLPDNKDPADCDLAEVDGELFVAQSNFTLILEGEEGEADGGDAAAAQPTRKEQGNEAELEDRTHAPVLPPASSSSGDHGAQTQETLPYVPEPMKAAIAENLLDVIKDTRSKELMSDAVEPSVHESLPLISQKATRSKSAKPALEAVEESSPGAVNVSRSEDVISSRTRTRGRRVQSLGPSSAPRTPAPAATPKTPGPTARKRAGKSRDAAEASESTCAHITRLSQSQETPPTAPTARRGRKKKVRVDTLESTGAGEEELQVAPGRGPKRLKYELPEPATKETPLRKEVKHSSLTKGTPRRTKRSTGNQHGAEMINDLTVNQVPSPSRTVLKLRRATLEAPQSPGGEREGGASQQPALPGRGATGRGGSGLSGLQESEGDPSLPALPAELAVAPTPRKRGRPRKVNPAEDSGSRPVGEETSSKKRDVVNVRRSTRITPARSANSASVPSELAKVTSSRKRITKEPENASQKPALGSASAEHRDEETHQEPPDGGSGLRASSAVAKSSHNTRTRSSKALLSDLPEPTHQPLFTPVAKTPRKAKAHETETSAQLKELVSDLSSQFAYSPPALRTRRKYTSSTPKIVDVLEDDTKSVEVVEEQKVKRARTVKSKQANKNKGRKRSWSPPPVEIKLISPLASPAGEAKSNARKPAAAAGKALGRGRKKPASFPKQILRRKML